MVKDGQPSAHSASSVEDNKVRYTLSNYTLKRAQGLKKVSSSRPVGNSSFVLSPDTS